MTQAIAKRALKMLLTMTLSRNTQGGANGYIAKFEQCLQDLVEPGQPYDGVMRKVTFLNNIEGSWIQGSQDSICPG